MKVLKYTGISAVLIEYCAIAYFMLATKHPLDISLPISYYGTLDSTRQVFSLSYSIAGMSFHIWVILATFEKFSMNKKLRE